MSSTITEVADLPITRRLVTGRDENAKSKVLYDGTDSNLRAFPSGGTSRFQGIWSTDDVPVDLSSATASDPTKGTQFRVINDGSTCSVTWTRPGVSSPMHHTQTIDYGVVLEGEVELELDNGETRVLKTGDVFVQRGAMHAWHNRHATKWAKLFCVVVASKTPAPEVQQASS